MNKNQENQKYILQAQLKKSELEKEILELDFFIQQLSAGSEEAIKKKSQEIADEVFREVFRGGK